MANAYTLVQALQAAGKNLTRQGLVDAINQHGASWTGPGLAPFRYSTSDHGGYSGGQIGHDQGRQDRSLRYAAHHHAGRRQPDHAVQRHPAVAAGQRYPVELEGLATHVCGTGAFPPVPQAMGIDARCRRRGPASP